MVIDKNRMFEIADEMLHGKKPKIKEDILPKIGDWYYHDVNEDLKGFWLEVELERSRLGGKSNIDDNDLQDEIIQDFIELTGAKGQWQLSDDPHDISLGNDVPWKLYRYRFISKLFDFNSMQILFQENGIAEGDKEYLRRFEAIADGYDHLSKIISRKRDKYKLTKNIRWITLLNFSSKQKKNDPEDNRDRTNYSILKWNTEDSTFGEFMLKRSTHLRGFVRN